MKNQKLNLNELKIESFITYLQASKSQTIKGGTGGWLVAGQGPGAQVVKQVNWNELAGLGILKAVEATAQNNNGENNVDADNQEGVDADKDKDVDADS